MKHKMEAEASQGSLRGHFSSSDQSLGKVWLKVSIAFIFSFNYTNHLDNKILTYLLLSSCQLETNQPTPLTFQLPHIQGLLFVLCRCEHYLRNDGNHCTSTSGHGGSCCIKGSLGRGALLLTNSLNLGNEFPQFEWEV